MDNADKELIEGVIIMQTQISNKMGAPLRDPISEEAPTDPDQNCC